ncbi:MAG: DEAD/DEAH box helicase [Nibricoccus sp.]
MRLDDLSGLQKLVLPDAWQARAIAGLKAGRDVVVDAPTGAGKTYVFERWAEQGNFSKRALFTVPTRALANDKYAEWKARGWRVGITTGDVSIDPGAPVIVATLEAVQGLLTRGADAVDKDGVGVAKAAEPARRGREAGAFQLLVVDEYQWIADPHRGNHYEGVILALDPAVQLLLLSGAVANPEEVAAWLERLGRKVDVVRTAVRPVPLEEVEVDDLVRGLPKTIEGFWSKRVAGALREGLGPVLVFAPHRQDAERLARQFARELPLSDPLTLTPEQESMCGPMLAKLLRQRVAYHHSGLTYAQRAGLIEPLAKAGQLRAVVATLGLAAGINFSLRSVMITAASYRFDQLEHEIEPHDLLQMIGRAGRRGLDEVGYVLCSASIPRMRRAAPLRLKRAEALPWAVLLRELKKKGGRTEETALRVAKRFFTDEPMPVGVEMTAGREPGELPCGQRTDTGRARLVRRIREPFPGCADCGWREECFQLSPAPTLLWQWQRCGVLDKELRVTARGEIVSAFLGPEGLALSAALEDRRYPVEDLIFDSANLFAGDRFAGTNPRRLGRLAAVCERVYRRLTIEGYLVEGLPPQYGFGGSDVVRALVVDGARARVIAAMPDAAGRGDIDRLMTEWRSLLRQIAGAEGISKEDVSRRSEGGEGESAAGRTDRDAERRDRERAWLSERWDQLRLLARETLGGAKAEALPDLPPLTAEQSRPVNHRFFKASVVGDRVAGR